MNAFIKSFNALHLWNVSGTFGRVEGAYEEESNLIKSEGDGWRISASIQKDASGVFVRRDTFLNTSAED